MDERGEGKVRRDSTAILQFGSRLTFAFAFNFCSRFKMSGDSPLNDFMGVETSKKRKRRTSFTPHALEILNSSFERNTHPSGKTRSSRHDMQLRNLIKSHPGTDITALAQALGYEREVIRIWFCNKRQALKNTVRMMSKGMPN